MGPWEKHVGVYSTGREMSEYVKDNKGGRLWGRVEWHAAFSDRGGKRGIWHGKKGRVERVEQKSTPSKTAGSIGRAVVLAQRHCKNSRRDMWRGLHGPVKGAVRKEGETMRIGENQKWVSAQSRKGFLRV